MRNFNVYLLRCEEMITHECNNPDATVRDVAITLAFAARADQDGVEKQDWEEIKQLILNRWGRAAAKRIQYLANKMLLFWTGKISRADIDKYFPSSY